MANAPSLHSFRSLNLARSLSILVHLCRSLSISLLHRAIHSILAIRCVAGFWYRTLLGAAGLVPPPLYDAYRWGVYAVTGSGGDHLTPLQRQQRIWDRANCSRVVLATCGGARFATLEDYRSIDAHVMTLVGDQDLTTPPSAALAIYAAAKHAHGPHLIPRMGHIVIVDAAELVAALLNRFFTKHAGQELLA